MKIDSSISAIVTGGASGLGLATVQALRAAGAKVAILDFNAETGERAAADTGSTFCQANVMDEDSLDAAFAKAREANGVARLLVACAGGGNAHTTVRKAKDTGELIRFPTADFARVVALNAVGTFATITRFAVEAAALDPIDGERGAVVTTASIAAEDGMRGQAAYASGKAAILGMTLPVARDLAQFGIRVNCILPGTFDTPLMGMMKEEGRAILAQNIPFPRRFGEASEYADLALFLLKNGYMNGETIRIDGAQRFKNQ